MELEATMKKPSRKTTFGLNLGGLCYAPKSISNPHMLGHSDTHMQVESCYLICWIATLFFALVCIEGLYCSSNHTAVQVIVTGTLSVCNASYYCVETVVLKYLCCASITLYILAHVFTYLAA